MLFDTHSHLDDSAFDADRETVLRELPDRGIGLVMNPGCSIDSSFAAVALANKYPYIYAAVGCQPDAANEISDEALERLKSLCEGNPKVRAVGEIGLDYHYEDIPREIQKNAFIRQMELARELKLPVIVHERDAHEDGMHIVRQFRDVCGVFHCYSGSLEMAKQLVDMGWYIGFTGVLTFKNARKAVEVAANLPKDRVVLETDAPYMAPEPFRGRRNDPRYLYRMAERLAQIWAMAPEEAEEITFQNGKSLYNM